MNSNNERSSVRKQPRRVSHSRSAGKSAGLNISTINQQPSRVPDFSHNYTPLRSSPPKKQSFSKSQRKAKKKDSIESRLDQATAVLRREKDSLQLALSSEAASRRVVEGENEQLRRQLLEQERELREFKAGKDHLEVDLRNSVQRSAAEFAALREANAQLVTDNEHLRNEVDKLRADL